MTAYEVRISYCISDLFSSDLLTPENANHFITPSDDGKYFVDVYSTIDTAPVALLRDADGRLVAEIARADLTRSEEHTSELQSLMRTSYAVFCLQHKKTDYQHYTRSIRPSYQG